MHGLARHRFPPPGCSWPFDAAGELATNHYHAVAAFIPEPVGQDMLHSGDKPQPLQTKAPMHTAHQRHDKRRRPHDTREHPLDPRR